MQPVVAGQQEGSPLAEPLGGGWKTEGLGVGETGYIL